MGKHTVYDRVTHAWVAHDGSSGVIHEILDQFRIIVKCQRAMASGEKCNAEERIRIG